MVAFKKILCPTDFSDFSDYAVRYAAAFAGASGASIDCVHVVDMGFISDGSVPGVEVFSADLQRSLESIREYAEERLDQFVRRERFRGAEVTPHLRTGRAAAEIVALADELGSDLIVIATHGHTGLERLVFGGTCDKVVRTAKVPVLSIKHPEHEALTEDGSLSIHKVLCPLDFSEFSRSALPMAQSLCKQFGADLVLAHIVDTRFDYPEWTAQAAINNSAFLAESAKENLEEVASEITGVQTEAYVEIGIPHRILNEKAATDNVDLIVMPTHGRRGITHTLLGSVAEKMVRTATRPVLTLRPAKVKG